MSRKALVASIEKHAQVQKNSGPKKKHRSQAQVRINNQQWTFKQPRWGRSTSAGGPGSESSRTNLLCLASTLIVTTVFFNRFDSHMSQGCLSVSNSVVPVDLAFRFTNVPKKSRTIPVIAPDLGLPIYAPRVCKFRDKAQRAAVS
jgi:hypothetical protein